MYLNHGGHLVSSLDIALTELRRVPTSLSIQDGSIARLAGRLQSAKWSLGWLVMGETYVRKNGGATPLLILIKILDAAQELHQRATTLSQIDQGFVDVELRREILAALDHTGKVLLHTGVFLRGTPLEDKRAGVFAAARELVHVPYTFEEFDEKYNSLRSLDGAPFTTSGQRIHWGK